MKGFIKLRTWLGIWMMLVAIICLVSCNDDDMEGPATTGNSKTFELMAVSNPAIDGTIKFEEQTNGVTRVTISLRNTAGGSMHPAHIHMNTAAEGGDIVVSLTPVDGSTGMSETMISETDNGMAMSYSDLIQYDGYVNVHASDSDLQTLVAQGDIGENALTGMMTSYSLDERSGSGVSGMAVFYERENGETLVELDLNGTPTDGMHPAHIHMNTAAEGGDIAITLNSVNGASGLSRTNVTQTDDGMNQLNYTDLIDFNGYINVHLSSSDLSVVAQGDIGQNALTGNMTSYSLDERSASGISGSAIFYERMNGKTLVELNVTGTPAEGMHPAHIHMNTAAEGGDIAVTLNSVNGSTGISYTSVSQTDDAAMQLGYDDLIDFDGYINIHFSASDLSVVAQGDIGQNTLTGNSMSYSLNDVPGVTGMATFFERKNGETLIELTLEGMTFAGNHPSHIHVGSVADAPGAIAITLTSVDMNGISRTQVNMDDAGNMLTYDDMVVYDGYVNVHLAADQLNVLIAQGDIGANVN